MIIDLFAGPGGWEEGARQLGRTDVIGLDLDRDACATAVAAGHRRIQTDVSRYPTAPLRGIEGLIASPPCTAFSLAGKGEGRHAMDELLEAVSARDWSALRDYDPSVWLPLEVGRWIEETEPVWVTCEQVPAVLPLWRRLVGALRSWGYAADARVLMAADHGVPQTRQRAFLVARRDGEPVRWPEPTHFDPRKGTLLFGRPWVSMAEALGWPGLRQTVRTGMNSMKTSRDPQDMVPYERNVTEPAPTVDAKVGSAWKIANEHTDPPMRWKKAPEWSRGRPATTVVSSFRPDIIASPGWRGPGDSPRQDAPESIRVTVQQAAVLQSFPADHPWQGSKTSQFRQVGNAVPPLLAAAVLRPLIGG